MTKQEKNEVIEVLKGKFTQYSNFYVTDTESLTVAQVSKLRNHCFDKQVEMKVAKNTLIKKALESLDDQKYSGVYDSLHKVTALLFSENPKDPALILSGFRKDSKGEKPQLKAAFINGDVFVGDNQLKALTQIKTKNELIGEVIGLLMSPVQRVLGALQNKEAATGKQAAEPVSEPVKDTAPVEPAAATVESAEPATQQAPAPAESSAPAAEEASAPAEQTALTAAEKTTVASAPAAVESVTGAEATTPEAATPVAGEESGPAGEATNPPADEKPKPSAE
jgi:large subunit ribosomal protein L10